MDFGLRQRVALVCGSSKGIGYATAMALAAEGADVAICARDPETLDRAARRIAAHGTTVLPIAADLSTTEGVEAVVRQATERFGHVDVLVTNTAGPPTRPALDFDWGQWQRAVELLLRSAVLLSRALVPGMRQRRWGRVVGITSLVVKAPAPALVLSNSLRAAVTGYFRTLAEEIAADGVTVNTVLPGYTETERLQELSRANAARSGRSVDEEFDAWRAVTPTGRLGRPDEIAAMIVFLASEPAAFVTGQAICVDGGAVRSLL
jgi:3-oxoacyl-[acyl-carrier protein] reductase